MQKLSKLVEIAKKSLLFTAPKLEKDLDRFFSNENDHIIKLANDTVSNKVKHLFWVGSGNSWCNLYSGKYILDKFTTISSDCFVSYELLWRKPKMLNKNSVAIFASYSGNTEDTVAALRYAKSKDAKTIAIVNESDSIMGKEADEVISIKSPALYILPLAFSYLYALEIARVQKSPVENIINELYLLPKILGKLYLKEEEHAKNLALKYKNNNIFYTLASGPLYGLGYKFGLTVFMENMRVHGSFIETSEFRHGPVEMLDREKPLIVFLIGSDESRAMSKRVLKVAQENGAEIVIFDFKKYSSLNPLFSPFILMVPLQWFAVYSSLLRGITDLDERALMGHNKLSKGKGITWP